MRHPKLVLLSSAVVMALCASAASAQETFDWTGPYAGVNAGAAFDAKTGFDRTTGFLANNTNALQQGLRPVEQTVDDSGFTGGVQIGYNYQLGSSVVAGIEADLAYTDIDKTVTLRNVTNIGALGAPSAVPVSRVNQYRGELSALGTVRGRLGMTFDRTLVYATGGVAHGRVKRETTFYGPNADTTPFFQGSENGGKTGYVYGAGIEYAMPSDSMFNVINSSAVTVKAEYLHYDLGDDTLTFPGVNGGATIGGYTSRVRTEGDIVRAGLNFKF